VGAARDLRFGDPLVRSIEDRTHSTVPKTNQFLHSTAYAVSLSSNA
jgi:hypothetical protein